MLLKPIFTSAVQCHRHSNDFFLSLFRHSMIFLSLFVAFAFGRRNWGGGQETHFFRLCERTGMSMQSALHFYLHGNMLIIFLKRNVERISILSQNKLKQNTGRRIAPQKITNSKRKQSTWTTVSTTNEHTHTHETEFCFVWSEREKGKRLIFFYSVSFRCICFRARRFDFEADLQLISRFCFYFVVVVSIVIQTYNRWLSIARVWRTFVHIHTIFSLLFYIAQSKFPNHRRGNNSEQKKTTHSQQKKHTHSTLTKLYCTPSDKKKKKIISNNTKEKTSLLFDFVSFSSKPRTENK